MAACWRRGGDGPWLLVSDRPDGPRMLARYAKRTWAEELSRDEKSSGFRWEESRVRGPEHGSRLVLLMAPATYLAPDPGARVIEAGLRRMLESSRVRDLNRRIVAALSPATPERRVTQAPAQLPTDRT